MIDIFDISGTKIQDSDVLKELPITKACQHVEELMKDDYVTLSWRDTKKYILPVGSYIVPFPEETNGGDSRYPIKYRLFEPYNPEQKNETESVYEPHFQHPIMWLSRLPFILCTGDVTDWGKATKKTSWSYTGSPYHIAGFVTDCINWLAANYSDFRTTIGDGWTAVVDTDLVSSASVNFDAVDILSGASTIAQAFDCEFHFDFAQKIFHLGTIKYDKDGVQTMRLKSGENVGVASVSRTKKDFHNAFIVKGSTRNLSQPTDTGENAQITERLTLDPVKYPDSIMYTDADGNIITRSEFLLLGVPMLTEELIFDDVYPKLELYMYRLRERKCYLLDDNKQKVPDATDPTGYKTYSKWYTRLARPVYTTDAEGHKTVTEWVDYKKSDFTIIDGQTLGISFIFNEDSGSTTQLMLGQGDFDLVAFDKETHEHEDDDVDPNGYTAQNGEYRIVFKEENNVIIPTSSNGGIYPQGADTPQLTNNMATLLNIVVNDSYKATAQQELEMVATKKVALLSTDLNNYELPSNPVWFEENNPELFIGQHVIYDDGQSLTGSGVESYTLDTHIIKIVTQVDYPFVKEITVGNEKVKSNITTLQEEVKTIITGGSGGSGSGGSISESQLSNLIRNYGAQYFLSKTKDDTASGEIGFLKGLWIKTKGLFGFDEDGNIKASTISTTGDANIDGLLRVNDIKSTNYTGEGMVGTGYMITSSWGGTQDSGAVFDYLTIRKKMIINSLEIKETEFSAGDQAFSGANMKVARTDYLHYDEATNTWTELGYSTTRVPWVLRGIPFLLSKFGLDDRARKMYGRLKKLRMAITQEDLKRVNRIRLYFLAKDGDREIENWWRVNDLARCQTQNLINTQQRETYVTDLEQHQGNIYWWRKVMRVSVNTGEPRYIWYDEEGNTSDKAVEGWTKKRGYNGTVANEVDYPGMTEDLYPTKAEDYGQPITIDGQKYHWIEVAYNYDEEVAAFAQGKHTGWCACYSDLPAVNDKVVQFGNAEDPDRMNVTTIEINGSGNPDAPAIKIYRGIFSFDNSQSWWGGKPQKMKLSPSTGYEFYGPMFKFVQEYGVARIHKAREEVYWSRIGFERDDEEKQTYPAYSDDVLNPNGTFKSRKDTTKTDRRYVRKCYYYDEVTHKGSLWLCTIANETYYWRWDGTSAITINSHTYQQGDRMLDSDYRSLTTEQKALCGRYRSYATTEPSEASGEWTKIVEKGDKGSSPVQAFRWYKGDITPQRPTEAAEEPDAVDHINDGEAYPADHWSKDAVNRPDDGWHLWMVTNTLYGDGTYGTWSTPMRISGATGSPGEDSSDTEWIYKRNNDGQTPSTPPNSGKGKAGSVTKDNWTADEVAHTDDWVPDGWTDNPQGIEPDMKYEFASFRVKPRGHNEAWGPFQTPITWSHWGRNGLDGDGVEYVFIRTNTNVPPTISESEAAGGGNAPYGGKTYKDDEFLPLSSEGRCTDDDLGPDENNKYEWCMKRRMTDPDSEGKRTWTKYVGTMNLWNRWADNAVRLALDNEHEDFLYNDAGTLISPANGATSDIHLYDGHNDKTSQTTLRVYDDGAGQWVTSTGASATAAASISGNRLTVAGLRAASVKVRVRGEYPVGSGQGQFYFAEFTANKTNQDKYDLVVEPSSIAYNPANYTAQTQKRIKVYADVTTLAGGTSHATIKTTAADGLRLYAKYVRTNGGSATEAQVTATVTEDGITKLYIDVTPNIASWNDGIYLELRKYDGSNYTVRDYETVEIAKSKNGESAFIIDLDNEEDAFGVDKDGDVIETQTRTTHVHLFYGTQKQTLTKNPEVTLSYAGGGTVPSFVQVTVASGNGTTEGTVSVRATGAANNTNRLTDTIYADIKLTCAKGELTHRFTIGLRRHGKDGVSPTFYQLAPTIDSFVFHRNADNTIERDTQTSQINVLEIHGGSQSHEISVLPSGYSIRYGFVGSSSSPTTIALGGNVEVTEQHVEEGYSRVWVELLNGSTSEDRETLPIVVDGENGANGADGKDNVQYTLMPTPSSVNFRVNAAGEYQRQVTLRCPIKKTVGDNAPTTIESGTDSRYIYYRISENATWSAWPNSGSIIITLSNVQSDNVSNIELVLLSQNTSTVTDAITVDRKDVPILLDGVNGQNGTNGKDGTDGTPGDPGKLFFPMGDYDNVNVTYERDELKIPMVFLDDGVWNDALDCFGNYWYLNLDSNVISGTHYAPGEYYGSDPVWIKANSFGLVIMQGIFAAFAKLGKGIFSGDYLFSMNGYIGGTAYNAGAKYKEFPAYSYFDGDPTIKSTLNVSRQNTLNTTFSVLHDNIYLKVGETLVLMLNVTYRAKITQVALFSAGGTQQTISYRRGNTKTWTNDVSQIPIGGAYDYIIKFTAIQAGNYALRGKVSSGTGAFDYDVLRVLFEPNWWVDLLTGKMVAARGNFVVDGSGNVEVSGKLRASVYEYKMYFTQSPSTSTAISPTDADYVISGTANNEEIDFGSPVDNAYKVITIENPMARSYDSYLKITSSYNIIPFAASTGGSTSYSIGLASTVKIWADPNYNSGQGVWRVIERSDW